MENVINALNDALGFAYDNILSILMMVLLIAAGFVDIPKPHKMSRFLRLLFCV